MKNFNLRQNMFQQTGAEIETSDRPITQQLPFTSETFSKVTDGHKKESWFPWSKNTESHNSDIPTVETFWEATKDKFKAGERGLKRSFMSLRGAKKYLNLSNSVRRMSIDSEKTQSGREPMKKRPKNQETLSW